MTPPLAFSGTTRFQPLRCLGTGGMGQVYEVHDVEQDVRVALKLLRDRDAHLVYRFKREFRALQDLRHHNLVSLGELFEHRGDWFFTMELVAGTDFTSYVTRGRRQDVADLPTFTEMGEGAPILQQLASEPHFDEQRLRASLRQLADGLSFLHDAGKVHRDIKPSNVLVEPGGRVVLLDFGLVAELEPGMQSRGGMPVGTPAYMAPEQATRAPVGPAADWYGVGVMLYQTLTGKLPFDGTAIEILTRKQHELPAPPRQLVPDTPGDLDELCMRLLTTDAAARPEAVDIIAALGGRRSRLRRLDTDLSRTALVGRQHELATLFELATQPVPCVAVVEGDSGFGKSSLLATLVQRLRREAPHTLLLSGRCHDNESVNYRGVDAVMDGIARHLWSLSANELARVVPHDGVFLARMFPVFRTVDAIATLHRRRIADDVQARQVAIDALRELLRRLARQHRIVIVIDDMQWSDNDSLTMLAELVRGADAPPLAIVLATRPLAESSPLTAAWRRLREYAGDSYCRVHLGPLSPSAAEELAEHLLRNANAGAVELAADVAREAAGHPLYIAELVHHAIAFARLPTALHLDDAIVARVSRLPGPTRQLAELIALAGAPVHTRTLRRAVEGGANELDRSLTTLRLQHLARRTGEPSRDLVEPYHDRVREALVASLGEDERRTMHERLAVAMLAAGDPPEALVRHLEGAGRFTRAADCAVEAARRATASLAFDRAAELYRTALRLGEHSDAVARALRKDLADVLVSAGRGHEAALVFSEAARGADPAMRMEYRRQAAEQLLITGYIDEGLDTLESLLREIDTSLPATPRRALWSLLRQRAALALSGLRWKIRRETEIPRETLVRLDVHRVVSHGLSMVDTIRGADFNARYLRLALRTGEPVRLCRALGIEAVFTGSQGGRGLRRARRLHQHIDRLAATEGDDYARAYSAGVDGVLAYFEGRFTHSAARLRESELLFNQVRVLEGYERNNVRIFRAFALMQSGDYRSLTEELHAWSADAERRGDHYLAASLYRRCSLGWIALGQVEQAKHNLTRIAWMPPEGRYHLQHWFEVLGRGEIALLEGHAAEYLATVNDALEAMRSALLLRVQMVRVEAYWLQARIHLAAAQTTGELRPALRLARRNRRRLAREPLAHARTMGDLIDVDLCALMGDATGLQRRLRHIITTADADTPFSTIARLQLAGLIGGDEAVDLRAEADAWRMARDIPELTPLLRVLTPCVTVAQPSRSDRRSSHPSPSPTLLSPVPEG